MKRFLGLLMVAVSLMGCGSNEEMEQALQVRSRLLSSSCSFRCYITADYIDTVETFCIDSTVSPQGQMEFAVVEPQSISGITGTVDGENGALHFDDTVLAFPLIADERISPVSSPWIMVDALKKGYIVACTQENEGISLTINDSYADDALTLQIRLNQNGCPTEGEIFWKGRAVVGLKVEDFSYETVDSKGE